MTLEGINQDLDDILADAGDPVWVGWIGQGRAYKFPGGNIRILLTKETSTEVSSHEWIEAAEAKIIDQPKEPKRIVEDELGVPYGEARRLVYQWKAKRRQEQLPATRIMKALGYTERTHPGCF